MTQILAGDVGGTKTVLALHQCDQGELVEIRKETYPSGQHHQFEDLLTEFLDADSQPITATFGIAGPVKSQRCITTNLPWTIDAAEIQSKLNIPHVYLLNDLEAAAYGILRLDHFHELNPTP